MKYIGVGRSGNQRRSREYTGAVTASHPHSGDCCNHPDSSGTLENERIPYRVTIWPVCAKLLTWPENSQPMVSPTFSYASAALVFGAPHTFTVSGFHLEARTVKKCFLCSRLPAWKLGHSGYPSNGEILYMDNGNSVKARNRGRNESMALPGLGRNGIHSFRSRARETVRRVCSSTAARRTWSAWAISKRAQSV